jgi:hypothetical protein
VVGGTLETNVGILHRNLKARSIIKPWKVKKWGEKCPRKERPKTIHII